MRQTEPYCIDAPIEGLTLLDGIPLEKRQSVLRCLNARIARFDDGDVLAGRSRAFAHTRYLIEGEALIVRYGASGNRSILGTYQEDSVIASKIAPGFCENNALDIVANGPCATIDFNISQEIEGCACCIKHINRIKSNLVASLTETNMRLVKRLDVLANRSTREKVLSYLQEQAQEAGSCTFDIPYNRQELADFLYIERSALSRELGRMRDEGIISFERNRFVIAPSYAPGVAQ